VKRAVDLTGNRPTYPPARKRLNSVERHAERQRRRDTAAAQIRDIVFEKLDNVANQSGYGAFVLKRSGAYRIRLRWRKMLPTDPRGPTMEIVVRTVEEDRDAPSD
jgi:hypothetical protein